MPASKAQQKAVTKYIKAKYDRFGLTMPKGNLDTIKAHAEACGESTNAFIGRAITETMERDSAPQEAAGGPQEAGVVSLPLEAIKTAQEAAEAAGETVPVFVSRAVETQAQRDVRASKEEGGERG